MKKSRRNAEALNLVARQATGSMRDAISLLDQLASAGDIITLKLAQDVLGTATSQAVLEVVEAMLKRQSAPGLEAIHRSLDSGSRPAPVRPADRGLSAQPAAGGDGQCLAGGGYR